MESRLPQPIREALLNNEMRSGIKLLAMALSGLVGAGGVSLITFILLGSKIAISIGGGVLIITAFTIFRALKNLDQPRNHRDETDRDLLNALVAMDRRAIVITGLEGNVVTHNHAFERISGAPVRWLGDLFTDDTEGKKLVQLVDEVAQFGNARTDGAIEGDSGPINFSGRRIGNYLLWQLVQRNDGDRLKHEKMLYETWASTVFEKLDCGVVLEDGSGRPFFINSVLHGWLNLKAKTELPQKLLLKAGDSQLLVGNQQRIDVDIIDVPLQTRERDRTVGRFRIIRKQEQMRGSYIPDEREFLIDPMFHASPLAVAVVDREGCLKECNLPLRRHPAGQAIEIGDSILGLVKKEDREDLLEVIEFAFDGRPLSHPLDIVFNSQPERVGQVFSTSIAKSDTRYAVLYLSDTTQEKSLERQFVQAQKMQAVGQLAGGVAHDFNNLLTAIIGFCDLLLVRHDARDQSFSDIIQIKQNANRAANLVRQLLAFSRQQTLRPKVLMLTDILAEITNLIRRLIGENIELKVVHGRDLHPVKVDQGQFEQVVINLAVNARDAMPNGGKLEIRTSMIGPDHPFVERYDVIVPDEYVLIEVQDTGCGIPKDNINKIFEPFFTTKEVGQGTGLGLATVYGIVKQTGGFVFVDTEENNGTTFLLFLKAHGIGSEEVEEPAAERPARDLTGKGTILLVEDEDPVRMFASRALTNKGYKVLEAASGEAGLEILKTHDEKIDLLISDVIMPHMDGPTLVKEARKDLPDLPVIFVSGYAEDVFRQNLEAEESQFLPKPFSLNDLAEKVKGILG
ncbi:MAG: response regulator [Kordiimonadaceae bacterium]|nr:response regulator [Kordiimonadaceae bacterium]